MEQKKERFHLSTCTEEDLKKMPFSYRVRYGKTVCMKFTVRQASTFVSERDVVLRGNKKLTRENCIAGIKLFATPRLLNAWRDKWEQRYDVYFNENDKQSIMKSFEEDPQPWDSLWDTMKEPKKDVKRKREKARRDARTDEQKEDERRKRKRRKERLKHRVKAKARRLTKTRTPSNKRPKLENPETLEKKSPPNSACSHITQVGVLSCQDCGLCTALCCSCERKQASKKEHVVAESSSDISTVLENEYTVIRSFESEKTTLVVEDEQKGRKCPDCDMVFHKTGPLRWHWRETHGFDEFICNICQCRYKKKPSIVRHIRDMHRKEGANPTLSKTNSLPPPPPPPGHPEESRPHLDSPPSPPPDLAFSAQLSEGASQEGSLTPSEVSLTPSEVSLTPSEVPSFIKPEGKLDIGPKLNINEPPLLSPLEPIKSENEASESSNAEEGTPSETDESDVSGSESNSGSGSDSDEDGDGVSSDGPESDVNMNLECRSCCLYFFNNKSFQAHKTIHGNAVDMVLLDTLRDSYETAVILGHRFRVVIDKEQEYYECDSCLARFKKSKRTDLVRKHARLHKEENSKITSKAASASSQAVPLSGQPIQSVVPTMVPSVSNKTALEIASDLNSFQTFSSSSSTFLASAEALSSYSPTSLLSSSSIASSSSSALPLSDNSGEMSAESNHMPSESVTLHIPAFHICSVCLKNKTDVGCSACMRFYHLSCFDPVEERDNWSCLFCQEEQDQETTSDSSSESDQEETVDTPPLVRTTRSSSKQDDTSSTGDEPKRRRSARQKVRQEEKRFKCDVCTFATRYAAGLQIHKRRRCPGRQFHCPQCSRVFKDDEELKEHRIEHTDWMCDLCGISFIEETRVRSHIVAHLQPRNNIFSPERDFQLFKQETEEGGAKTVVYECLKCHKDISETHLAWNHRVVHAGRYFECNRCDRVYYTKDSFNVHMDLHKKKRLLDKRTCVCEICGRTIPKSNEIGHRAGHIRWKCKTCGEYYSKKCDFQKHEAAHARNEKSKNPLPIPINPRTSCSSNLLVHPDKVIDIESHLVCEVCGQRFLQHRFFKRHLESHKRYKCNFCSKTFARVFDYQHHLETHVERQAEVASILKQMQFQCGLCGQKTRHEATLRRHMEKYHKDTTYSETLCNICGKTFDGLDALNTHQKCHQNFECSICQASFRNLSEFNLHFQAHGSPDDGKADDTENAPNLPGRQLDPQLPKPSIKNVNRPSFSTCNVCNESFPTKAALYLHFHEAHTPNSSTSYCCSECPESFRTEEAFLLHRKTHADGNTLAHSVTLPLSTNANQEVSVSSSVLKHEGLKNTGHNEDLESNFGDTDDEDDDEYDEEEGDEDEEKPDGTDDQRNFICELCGKCYRWKHSLEKHKALHTRGKLVCNICGFQASRRDHLLAHQRSHTASKRHECQICGAGFSRRTRLRGHMKQHADGEVLSERKISCSKCTLKFVRQSDLTRHYNRDHTSIEGQVMQRMKRKTYKCEACGVNLKSKKDLRRHLTYHIGYKMYKCEVCNDTFHHHWERAMHRREEHPHFEKTRKRLAEANAKNKKL